MSVDDEDEKRLGKPPTFKELFLAIHLVKESKKKFWDGLYDESLDGAVFCTNQSKKAYEEYALAMIERYVEDVTQHLVGDADLWERTQGGSKFGIGSSDSNFVVAGTRSSSSGSTPSYAEKTFWRIMKKRSTEEFECVPYICTLLNSSLWTYYGITKPGSYLVATVNGFGVIVEIVYISLFLIYAPPRTRAKTATLVGIVDVFVFTGAVFLTQFGMEGEMRINVIGFMGAALNIVMYASPLSAMRLVWITKSVEYMPFLLSLFMFLNGAVWTFYAFLVQDLYLG
ncbi:hypothetical protein R6Q57_020170, partial [Mikania cordata]